MKLHGILLILSLGIVLFIPANYIIPKFTKQGNDREYTKEFINTYSVYLKSKYPCLKTMAFYTGGGINVVIDDNGKELELTKEIQQLNYKLEIIIHCIPKEKIAQQGDAPETGSSEYTYAVLSRFAPSAAARVYSLDPAPVIFDVGQKP